MLYTAQSASLATLETVVHIAGMRLSAAYCMIVLQIPNELIAAVLPDELPSNWNAYPAPEALRTIGDRFIQSNTHLALKVPSAIVPDDYNFLLNPLHLEFHRVKILQQRTYNFDGRLVR
jgi:RES domain-containing protein